MSDENQARTFAHVALKLCRDAADDALRAREKLEAARAVLELTSPSPFPHCSGCYAIIPPHLTPPAHVRLPARMMLLALCADCAPGAVVEQQR
jgi:hypothetical protein